VKHQGELFFYGPFQMPDKQILLLSRGSPVALVEEVKAGLPNRREAAFLSQGFQQGQGFLDGKAGRKALRAGAELFLDLRRGQLGMYPKTANQPGRSSLPGEGFVGDKVLPVPGTGGTGNTEPAPFLLGGGETEEEFPEMAMGIGDHDLIIPPPAGFSPVGSCPPITCAMALKNCRRTFLLESRYIILNKGSFKKVKISYGSEGGVTWKRHLFLMIPE
jgi:hypothetical protein